MSEPSRASMSDPESTSPIPGSSAPDETDEEDDLSPLPPAHQDVVRRLRAKVERATALLERLQDENERLRKRVQKLEKRPDVPGDKTVLALDDDPEALRDRISTFIEAIDTYLDDGAPETTETELPHDVPSPGSTNAQ